MIASAAPNNRRAVTSVRAYTEHSTFSDNGPAVIPDNGPRVIARSTTAKLAAVVGITTPFEPFRCVLPGHADCAAELYRNPARGYWRYRCAAPWSGGLAEVRASLSYAEPRTLSGVEAARWRERLEFDAGLRKPQPITILPKPDASSAATRVADGIRLFLGLRDGEGWQGKPFTFSRQFAAAYCDLSENVARRGIAELRKAKVIDCVGQVELGPVRRAHLWRVTLQPLPDDPSPDPPRPGAGHGASLQLVVTGWSR